MVERLKKVRGGVGGARPGAGRKPGGVSESTRVARALAARGGRLPHELLLEWARTGFMTYPGSHGRRPRTVQLSEGDRISCAKGCAAWYKAPMQAVKVSGDAERPVVVTLGAELLRALTSDQADKAEFVRDVLQTIQAGGGMSPQMKFPDAGRADPSRYAETLRRGETIGRA